MKSNRKEKKTLVMGVEWINSICNLHGFSAFFFPASFTALLTGAFLLNFGGGDNEANESSSKSMD